jgi:Domain of unknown function (DUF4157)
MRARRRSDLDREQRQPLFGAEQSDRPTSARPTAGTWSPAQLLALQRTIGNAAVARLVELSRQALDGSRGHPRQQPSVQRSVVHDVLRSPGKPLDEPLRAEMEARLDADFSDVRLHTDAAAQSSATEVGARAYTSGNHVVIGPGGADAHTLAHELTHVVQQRQGHVLGTDNGDGLLISDPSDRFERAAEANAARAMARAVPISKLGAEQAGPGPRHSRSGHAEELLQRMPEPGSFGTYTMHQLPVAAPIHPTNIAFVDHVYGRCRADRNNINNPWQSNLAVLEYVNNDTGQTEYLDSFNVSLAHHSEEAIFAHLEHLRVNYRPVRLFSDREPCSGCLTEIKTKLNTKARGYDMPIYYITNYPGSSQADISAWWQ